MIDEGKLENAETKGPWHQLEEEFEGARNAFLADYKKDRRHPRNDAEDRSLNAAAESEYHNSTEGRRRNWFQHIRNDFVRIGGSPGSISFGDRHYRKEHTLTWVNNGFSLAQIADTPEYIKFKQTVEQAGGHVRLEIRTATLFENGREVQKEFIDVKFGKLDQPDSGQGA